MATMHFSPPTLHPTLLADKQHLIHVHCRMSAVLALRPRLGVLRAAAGVPVSIPLTTISQEGNFDAWIEVQFTIVNGQVVASLLVDSGNSTMIIPYGENLAGAPGYTVLGTTNEPWGCRANVMKGPAQIIASDGSIYQIDNCVFYACIGNNADGKRTANFGTGRVSPWSANGSHAHDGLGVTIQSPLSYNTAYPYAEFVYAPAEAMFSSTATPHVNDGSLLILHATRPSGFTMLEIIPNLGWMSVVPAAFAIGSTATAWPGSIASPIAMVDTGGGPVLLSDPNGVVWREAWPNPVPCPLWTGVNPPESKNCNCVSDRLTLSLKGSDGMTSYTYTIDTSAMPASVRGLTAVMCELNGCMMGQEGMNIGGITALFNRILIDYAGTQLGFAPK
jgi:hypothetical protein